MANIPSYALDLMTALGPQTDGVDWVAFDSEAASWWIGFDNQSSVLLEWFDEQESFVLNAPLGAPPPEARLQAYQAVLAYNALWRDNGGARIGLADAHGGLSFMVDLPARSLTLDQLQQVVLGVQSQAEQWSRCVANPGEAEGSERSALPSPLQRV